MQCCRSVGKPPQRTFRIDGSLTTAIVVLLSVEIGALVLLIGAQVIAEYERIAREPVEAAGRSMTLD